MLLPACTASCGALMRAAKAAGCWVTSGYRPGDVAIYDFPGSAATDHCGIVESVGTAGIMAIEGNRAVGNDDNGGKVMERSRKFGVIVGAVRPKYDTEEVADMFDVETMTEEQLIRLAERMQAALAKRPISDTRQGEVNEAVALGITDGSNPNALCTRAQAAVMVKRAVKP